MNIVIVDDEQPARERLRRILADNDHIDVVGEAGNGNEAIALCEKLQPDVVLLDIRMPGIDGIDTAHQLNTLPQAPAIVFTTAYDEYAVEAFEAQAIGYVLKPVRRGRLLAALKQASRIAPATLTQVANDVRLDSQRKHICAYSHGELKLIPVTEIICFRADKKYVTVDHDGGQDLIDEALRSLADEFSAEFVRVHRSALVAVNRIDRIEKTSDGKSCIVLREGSQVTDNEMIISRRHVADVRKRLKGA